LEKIELIEEEDKKRKTNEVGLPSTELKKEDSPKDSPRVGKKQVDRSSVLNKDTNELTYQILQMKLKEASDDMAMNYMKQVLKQFEEEKTLRKLIKVLYEDDPKGFLLKVGDVSDFKLAKFGGLKKLDAIMPQ